MATYTQPKYRPCADYISLGEYGPLYYNFVACADLVYGTCPPDPCKALSFPPSPPCPPDSTLTCEEFHAGCASCAGSPPGGDWTLLEFGGAPCSDPFAFPPFSCGWWYEGLVREHPAECGGAGVSIHPDFVLNDAGGTNYFGDDNPSAIWAECGQLGPGDAFSGWDLDPAHPDCYCCSSLPSHCQFFCTDFPEPECVGEWNTLGFGNGCNSNCPFCPTGTFDAATGLCQHGPDDGNCPPGTHWDPVCRKCVSDVPPRRCWAWRDCKWNPPRKCDFPLIFDPIGCGCFCPPRACGPHSQLDPVTCTCLPCNFGECWCVTEQRCITCVDPPCKSQRQCVWDVLLCDWDCLPQPPGSSGCSAGEHYDLVKCRCITDCPSGQCWCEGSSACIDCAPPPCTAELHCKWDVDLCDWVCDDPPCKPPSTWDAAHCRCVGVFDGPYNILTPYGNYHASSAQKGVLYQRSDYTIPPFVSSVQVTTDPGHKQPRMVRDWRHRTLLLYMVTAAGGASGKVVERVSDDDGNTWSHERTVFVDMSHAIPAGPHPFSGCVIYAAYNGGKITATRRYPGDTADSTPFDFKDQTGADLSVDDTSFGLRESWDGPGRWLLHVLSGGTLKHFQSWDDCQTWIEVS